MPDVFDKYRKEFGAEKVDNFLANFGLGPKYVPKEPKKHKCPKCGQESAIYKEIHPDTDMNEMVLFCKDCGYEE